MPEQSQETEYADDEVICTLNASGVRRTFGMMTLLILGGLVVYLALAQPPATIGWQIFMIAFGLSVLWIAARLHYATGLVLSLTPTSLTTSDGRVVFNVADVESVARGFLAFKPSHGFAIKMKTRQPMGWAPGMWWSFGRSVGIGGVTAAGQGKSMAEILTLLVAQRDSDLSA
ncbi:hypothetical protein [Cochlodiniinecator piscidefendens]|uniref:hypothetical protein n=1 Tax=Cochlodiniinecator piscidefendens TaxID=2715756 RepID=UPI00140BC8FF|nr:hypothetical protein [Cochlodiniinecator piscidefendens]